MNAVATALSMLTFKDVVSARESSLLFFGNNEEVVSRLKFIGHIEKDEKINVRHVYREPDTFFTKISRSFLYKDNRKNALQFIRDVIDRSFELLELYHNRGNIEYCKSLIADLLRAKKGIFNLKQTYIEDTKFCCDMDVIIQTIDSKIKTLQVQKEELFRDLRDLQEKQEMNEKKEKEREEKEKEREEED